METYIIGICNRFHDAVPILVTVNAFIFIFFVLAYFHSKDNIDKYLTTESDYKLNKVGKIGSLCCLVVFVIILLLYIFTPTGEEVRLMMYE